MAEKSGVKAPVSVVYYSFLLPPPSPPRLDFGFLECNLLRGCFLTGAYSGRGGGPFELGNGSLEHFWRGEHETFILSSECPGCPLTLTKISAIGDALCGLESRTALDYYMGSVGGTI